jgi:hypothetical protein
MKVTSFTVSKSIDLYRGGEKSSYFVSMAVEPDGDLKPEDLPLAQLDAATFVKKACIYNALTDGKLRLEEANELLQDLKDNTALIREKLEAKKK